MSKMIVSHSMAIKFWRTHSLDETDFTRAETPPSVSSRHFVDEVFLHALGFDTTDIHLLISRDKTKDSGPGITFHHWKGKLPRGSLRKVRGNIYVSSPEMCFLFAAQQMSLLTLIMYGMEICGTYSIDENLSSDERYGRKPLTTVKRIAAFLDRCDRHNGICLARKALQFISDGSASPMETTLTMLLCMPTRYGGYGIPRPTLNEEIPLGARLRRYTSAKNNVCDLSWSTQKVVVEYDSTERHYGEANRTKDVKRANIIEHAGRRVITITWQMVNDPEGLETAAEIIAAALEHRLNKRMDRRAFVHARNMLRKEVLPRLPDSRAS